MTQPNDGGPAFPSTVQDDLGCYPRYAAGYGGMSLRDWFASHASEQDIQRHQRIIERSNGYTYKPSVEECKYAYASEMLKARSANV